MIPESQCPIGKFKPPEKISDQDRQNFIRQIEEAPEMLRVWLQEAQKFFSGEPGAFDL